MATSVVSAMLVAGMAMPSLAVNSATEVRYSEKYLSSPAIAIDLKSGERDLSREELATLVSDRYNTTLVSVADEDGSTVTSGNVGTDYEARLGNGKYAKVVLYGDLNSDGIVDLRDANILYQTYTSKATLREVLAKAGDLTADGAIDLRDANRAYNYYTRSDSAIVADLDKLPEQEVQVLGNYSVTFEDRYVNNQNENAYKGMLEVSPELEEKIENIYFYAVDANGDLVATNPLAGPYTLEAYTSKIPVVLDTTQYASMPDGVNTIKAIVAGANHADYQTGEVLATFTIEKHTDEIDAAKIVGVRGTRPASTGANAGSVSFDIQSDVKIVKAYYVAKTSESAPTTIPNDFQDNDNNYTGVINVNDNKVTNASVKLDVSNQAYYVYFILEDEYGSVSTSVCNGSSSEAYALIPPATYTKTAKVVTTVEMPNLEDVTALSDAKATITTSEVMSATDKFQAVLYKDGKPFATATVTGASSGKTVQVALSTFNLVKDSTTLSSLEAGEYYMSVFGEGNATDTVSTDAVGSNTVTVSPIASVSDIDFTRYMDNGTEHTKLSWKTPHNRFDIATPGYEVYVSAYDQTAKAYNNFSTKISRTQTENPDDSSIIEQIDPGRIKDNTLYKAKIVTLVKTPHKLSEANSLPTISKEFFRLETPKVVVNSATSSEATLELESISSSTPKDNTISGKIPTYSVEVYIQNPNYQGNSATEAQYIRASQYDQAVEVNASSGRFTVKDLTGDTHYAIKLVATVQGESGAVRGESEFVDLGTKKAMFNIDNKEVTTNADTRNGKIHATSTVVSVDGVDYKISEYVELSKVAAIVKGLKNGDHITYSTATPNEVSIAISTTDNVTNVRTLPAAAKDMVVNITGNPYDQKIATTASNNPAQVNITGMPGGSLDISGVTAKDNRIVITNATVKTGSSAKDVVIAAGSTVTFDGYYTATASVETPVKVESGKINVTKTNSNVLDVTGFTTGLVATVSGTGTQEGTITLKGKGNVEVVSSGVTVASTVNVTTIDGKVNLSSSGLTGHQSVTVTYTTTPSSGSNDTVTAFANEVAPFDLTNIAIKQYDYNDSADKAAVEAITGVKVMTDKGVSSTSPVVDVEATRANVNLLNNYLAKFGLTGTDNNGKSIAKYGATISVSKDSKLVTITFSTDTKDAKGVSQPVTIEGLR